MANDHEHKVISFQEALALSENIEHSVLIGNGFSDAYFNYANLLQECRARDE